MADKFKPLFLTAEFLTVPGKKNYFMAKAISLYILILVLTEFLFSKCHVCHHEHIDTTMKCLT